MLIFQSSLGLYPVVWREPVAFQFPFVSSFFFSWSGLFCTLWLSTAVLSDDCLIKVQSSGALESLFAASLFAAWLAEKEL